MVLVGWWFGWVFGCVGGLGGCLMGLVLFQVGGFLLGGFELVWGRGELGLWVRASGICDREGLRRWGMGRVRDIVSQGGYRTFF